MTRSIDDLFTGFDWSQKNVQTFSNYEEQIAKECFEPAKFASLEKMQELMDSMKPVPKQSIYLNPADLEAVKSAMPAGECGTVGDGAISRQVQEQFSARPFACDRYDPLEYIPSANDLLLTMIVVGISIAWGLHLWFAMAGGP